MLNYLVELQDIKKLEELAVLLVVLQLDVVLLEAVEGELGLVVDVHLHRILHELLAHGSDVLGQGGREHHDLLLLWCLDEDLLYVLAHVNLVKALVALIEDKLRQLIELQVLLAQETKNTSWCAYQHMRAAVL